MSSPVSFKSFVFINNNTSNNHPVDTTSFLADFSNIENQFSNTSTEQEYPIKIGRATVNFNYLEYLIDEPSYISKLAEIVKTAIDSLPDCTPDLLNKTTSKILREGPPRYTTVIGSILFHGFFQSNKFQPLCDNETSLSQLSGTAANLVAQRMHLVGVRKLATDQKKAKQYIASAEKLGLKTNFSIPIGSQKITFMVALTKDKQYMLGIQKEIQRLFESEAPFTAQQLNALFLSISNLEDSLKESLFVFLFDAFINSKHFTAFTFMKDEAIAQIECPLFKHFLVAHLNKHAKNLIKSDPTKAELYLDKAILMGSENAYLIKLSLLKNKNQWLRCAGKLLEITNPKQRCATRKELDKLVNGFAEHCFKKMKNRDLNAFNQLHFLATKGSSLAHFYVGLLYETQRYLPDQIIRASLGPKGLNATLEAKALEHYRKVKKYDDTALKLLKQRALESKIAAAAFRPAPPRD